MWNVDGRRRYVGALHSLLAGGQKKIRYSSTLSQNRE